MSHSQAPLCYCTLRMVTKHAEGTFESLRYAFGGDHPSKTTNHTLFGALGAIRLQINEGWYFKVDSTKASAPASQSPTYPTHRLPKVNVKL